MTTIEEKSVDAARVGLTLFVLATTVVLVLFTGYFTLEAMIFDHNFQKGEIEIPANVIKLGETGYPKASEINFTVPTWDGEISARPRLYRLMGCETLQIPGDTRAVYAATDYVRPDLIQITVLPEVQVCGPENTTVNLILWIKR